MGNGEGGHERVGLANGDPSAPEFFVGGDGFAGGVGQMAKIWHHAGAGIGLVTNGAGGREQGLTELTQYIFPVTGGAVAFEYGLPIHFGRRNTGRALGCGQWSVGRRRNVDS